MIISRLLSLSSEQAKKRHLTEQRLQNKLRKETDSVRRAEEAKKDKTVANRKEEELQLKDSIVSCPTPLLDEMANQHLSTNFAERDFHSLPAFYLHLTISPLKTRPYHPMTFYQMYPVHTLHHSTTSLPSSHPRKKNSSPDAKPRFIYFSPTFLHHLTFCSQVQDAAQKEWSAFRTERSDAIEEIKQLRQRVVEEEARKKAEQELAAAKQAEADMDTDTNVADDTTTTTTITMEKPLEHDVDHDIEMDVDVPRTSSKDNGKDGREPERKEESVPMQGDDDDAVEY